MHLSGVSGSMSAQGTAVHCFGKLPLAGDFLRHGLETPEARAFAGWMEKGHALTEALRRSSGKGRPADPPARRRYRFTVDQGTGESLVAGILHESHDKVSVGASRRFPFAYFVSFEASALRKDPTFLPCALAPLWTEMEARLDSFSQSENSGDLFQRVDAPGLTLPSAGGAAAIERELAGASAGSFWSGVLRDGQAEARLALFHLLLRVLRPLAGVPADRAKLTLKLPLGGSSEDVKVQSAFWYRLVSSLLRAKGRAPSLFLSAPEPSGPAQALLILHQTLDETSFACLMTEQYEAEYVDDLTRSLPRAAHQDLSGEQKRVLLDDRLSLLDLAGVPWL